MNLFIAQRLRSFDFQFLVEAAKHMKRLSFVGFEVLDERSLDRQLQDRDGDGPYLPKSVFWLVRRFLLSLPTTLRHIAVYVGPLTPTTPYNFPQDFFSWSRFSRLVDARMIFKTDLAPLPRTMDVNGFHQEVEHIITSGINAAIPHVIPRRRLYR